MFIPQLENGNKIKKKKVMEAIIVAVITRKQSLILHKECQCKWNENRHKRNKGQASKNYDAIKMCIITSIISLIIGTGGGAIIALIIK